MTDMPPEGGWAHYQALVLAELKRHSTMLGDMTAQMSELTREIAIHGGYEDRIRVLEDERMKTAVDLASIRATAGEQARIYGAIAGAVLGAIATAVMQVVL